MLLVPASTLCHARCHCTCTERPWHASVGSLGPNEDRRESVQSDELCCAGKIPVGMAWRRRRQCLRVHLRVKHTRNRAEVWQRGKLAWVAHIMTHVAAKNRCMVAQHIPSQSAQKVEGQGVSQRAPGNKESANEKQTNKLSHTGSTHTPAAGKILYLFEQILRPRARTNKLTNLYD